MLATAAIIVLLIASYFGDKFGDQSYLEGRARVGRLYYSLGGLCVFLAGIGIGLSVACAS